MKKYLTHFIYIIVITSLAIASRLKTNELEEQVEKYRTQAMKAIASAEHSANQAAKVVESANEARLRAEEALQNCKNR